MLDIAKGEDGPIISMGLTGTYLGVFEVPIFTLKLSSSGRLLTKAKGARPMLKGEGSGLRRFTNPFLVSIGIASKY
jgi:hypothetical protein